LITQNGDSRHAARADAGGPSVPAQQTATRCTTEPPIPNTPLDPTALPTLLCSVADVAAGLTALLDRLRSQYTLERTLEQHPLCSALEQAAAAAHDLDVGARFAGTVAARDGDRTWP
jgi:hypothetical protein